MTVFFFHFPFTCAKGNTIDSKMTYCQSIIIDDSPAAKLRVITCRKLQLSVNMASTALSRLHRSCPRHQKRACSQTTAKKTTLTSALFTDIGYRNVAVQVTPADDIVPTLDLHAVLALAPLYRSKTVVMSIIRLPSVPV